MNNLAQLFCYFIIVCVGNNLFAEDDPYIDSLKAVIDDPNSHDSLKIKAYFSWDSKIYISDPDLDFELNLKIEELCLKNLEKVLPDNEKEFYQNHLLGAYNSLGIVYVYDGDYATAIEYFHRCLSIHEKAAQKKEMANVLNNIGVIHNLQKDFNKAMEYFNRSLRIREEIDDRKGIVTSLGNIANIDFDNENYDDAIVKYRRALGLSIEIEDDYQEARALNNIGRVLVEYQEFDSAMFYFQRSLDLRTEMEDLQGSANTYLQMGGIYLHHENYSQAIRYYKNAYTTAKECGAAIELRESASGLSTCYKNTGNYKVALEMHEEYIYMRDSLESEENKQEVLREQFKYEYEKQHMADSLEFAKQKLITEMEQQAERNKRDMEREQEATERYLLYAGIGLLVLLGVGVFLAYNQKKKDNLLIQEQKLEVEVQKEIVEERNNEILDSISYAKRIQSAILPPDRMLKEHLPEFFVLYRPKDVVAGDFYWLEKQGGKVLFAAADCTGHGVPGAMVSVICNNALNRSVREHGLTDPGKILDKSREIVIQEFEKSDEEVKDGMDIALCSLEGNILMYAGAHNPLWILRNKEVKEIKADKQPIGQFERQTNFTTHSVELQKNDSIYIFSDGFVDQFGGEKGKKFKAKPLKELLLSIQHRPMTGQMDDLANAFDDWKGDLEQVDDLCMIGIRF